MLSADVFDCICSKKALDEAAEQESSLQETPEAWLQLHHINGYSGPHQHFAWMTELHAQIIDVQLRCSGDDELW